MTSPIADGDLGTRWSQRRAHQRWLHDHAISLLDFYQHRSIDPDGGFFELEDDGSRRPTAARQLFTSTRMVHVFGIAELLGKPGARAIVDHGMRHLREALADREHGGWYWSVGADGPVDASKQHYGHAFAILAGATASQAGHPDGPALLEDALAIHEQRFWDERAGAARESFAADWSAPEAYRGQNGNMHLTEALMAAFEVTGDDVLLERAHRIADKLVNGAARANGWRLAEHYTQTWEIDFGYNREDPFNLFRPYGSTTGHWLEWARLVLQLWELRGRADAWMPEAAARLFDRAVQDGWDARAGGFCFTVDWDGRPFNRDRYWWTVTEAIGAASFLARIDGDERFERQYRRFWDYADRCLIDHEHGSWFHQLTPENRPTRDPWFGKPDVYHSFQACLVPLIPTDVGLARGVRDGWYGRDER
ncbi:AGE family epimerase/isomerase [Conexibacter sp. CPCC 206217]|uniref:AGE family epimerase/isomerase n=1 Tax=Conexibacter sp. CPCC 206217 TaxID=3064574 RepID=UPI0027289BE5|nr:AGE family epimerase/isomerase [Conexibacter sp. CPCC 206217]MDO8208783.1 AGE family epimerase/isomerase [Conexibacter sp. CPCC 206217]